MPRDGSGVASKPAGTTFAPNTTIESSKVNSLADDIYSMLNTALPITAGGTGASTAATARTALGAAGLADENTFTKTQIWAKGADVASANALTLGDDGNYFDITGTTSITSIATVGVGAVIRLHFDAALTLTHHATDLVLPGGANITTAAGDEAEFVEYAAGDWRCVAYRPTAPVVNTLNGQYKFPATQNPSSDANTLDDYEEGTWVANITFATPGNLSASYAVRNARYVKVGRLVTVSFDITTSVFTYTTSSGALRVTGLPFTSLAATGSRGAGYIQGYTKANYTMVVAEVAPSTDYVGFIVSGSGQVPTGLTTVDVPSGGTVSVYFTVTYEAAA